MIVNNRIINLNKRNTLDLVNILQREYFAVLYIWFSPLPHSWACRNQYTRRVCKFQNRYAETTFYIRQYRRDFIKDHMRGRGED
jgi:hypothetical protein